jgi:hypothetical protein
MRQRLIIILWAVAICCVIVGSPLPAASPVAAAVGRLPINEKVEHLSAYLVLSLLPVISFRNRRCGIMAGISMFLLAVLLEGGQHFSPGGAWSLAT